MIPGNKPINNRVLHHTTRWLCFLGFLDLVSVSMIVPLMSRRTIHLGANPFLQGVIGSVYGGVQLLSAPTIVCFYMHLLYTNEWCKHRIFKYNFAPFFCAQGSWSDVLGRKSVLIICMLATACGYFILSLPTLLFVTLSRVICGIFKQSQSISQAVIADSVPSSESAVHFGYFNAVSSLGFIVGPTLGGHMADLEDGFFWICTTSAILFILNAALVWKVLPAPSSAVPKSTGPSPGVVARLKELNITTCWDILLMRFCLSLAALVYRSSFHYSVEQMYDLTPKHIGYLMSFQGLVSGLAGFLIGPVGKVLGSGSSQLMIESFLLTVSLIGTTFAGSVPMLMVSLTVLNFTTSLLRVSVTKMVVNWCPPDKIGAMVGVGQSITSIGRMLSPLIGGMALQVSTYGAGVVSIVFAVIGFLVCCYTCSKMTKPIAKSKES